MFSVTRESMGIFAVCGLLLAGVAAAQTNTGGFTGIIRDSSGGVLPGVTVTVTSQETGFVRTAVTNELGSYLVRQLTPGTYTVSAELPGFKSALHRDIEVHIQEVVNLDVTMEVGEVTEQVEVIGQAPVLETTNATLGAVVDQDMVNDLPLDGRNYTQLLLLTSGASTRARDQSQGSVAGTSAISVAVNGQRAQNNRFTLNGVFNQEVYHQTAGLAPPIDAIREFKVATHSSSAEYEALGGSVNVEMKSGTNEFHGNVWHFHRNDNLDANFFFTNRAGQPKPEFKQNQFGFTFGGPIKSGHSFFFGTYEGFRQMLGRSAFATLPTAAMKAGDFTGLEPIFDPLTTRPDPNNPDQLIRDQFSGNQIPAGRINPASKVLMDAFYPNPNLPGLANNFIDSRPLLNDRNNVIFRLDTRMGENTQLWGHYGYSQVEQSNPSVLLSVVNFTNREYQNSGVNMVHTFSPVSILSSRIGYSRFENIRRADKPLTRREFFDRGGVTMFQEEVPTDAFVGVSIEGVTGIGASGHPDIHNVYQLASTYQHTMGKHSLSFGGDIRRYMRMVDWEIPMLGSTSFDNLLTLDPQNPEGTGHGFATFLLGYPAVTSRGLGDNRVDSEQWGSYFYVQDDIRMTPKLTLNLGLRYQYDAAAVDKLDRLASVEFITRPGVDPRSPNGMDALIIFASTNPFTGEPANAPRGIIDPDRNDFAPRFGFAYKLTPAMVLRGGYGVFYDSLRFLEIEDMRGRYPFILTEFLILNRETLPDVNWQSEIPFVPGVDFSGWAQDRRNRHGYSQQWNLSVQRQILQEVLLEVGYLGNHNVKQIRYYPFNDAQPGPEDPNPRRPVPWVGPQVMGANDANSNYHALQTKLNKRFSRGLGFMTMWTWAKAIDDMSDLADFTVQDAWNRRADRAAAKYDARHIFVNAFIYELPIGPGRGIDVSGWKNALLGDWQVQGIVRLESGAPVNIRIGGDNGNTGTFLPRVRPNLVGDPDSGFTQTVDEWFNRAAFSRPSPFTFGDVGRNFGLSDNRRNFDFSIFKNFPVPQFGEAGRVEFRAEIFNILNHQDFGDPASVFGTSTFGRINSSTPPRDIQLALKIYF